MCAYLWAFHSFHLSPRHGTKKDILQLCALSHAEEEYKIGATKFRISQCDGFYVQHSLHCCTHISWSPQMSSLPYRSKIDKFL
jgi:hypothetical protein